MSRRRGETISEAVERIEETGATVAAAHYARGDAATEVCALAAEIDVDLVVVDSRGLGPVGWLTDGSGSERVVRLAACSVLMARDVARDGARHRGLPRAWSPAWTFPRTP